MDMYQAIMAENKQLEKTVKRLVDSSSSQTQLRRELLAQIAAKIDAIEFARDRYVFPEFRVTGQLPDILEKYKSQMNSIKELLQNLREMNPGSTDVFETTSEIMQQEVIDYIKWEKNEAYPAMGKIIDDERAAELGEQIRVNEKLVYAEQIKKY
jgi:hypothetical protein